MTINDGHAHQVDHLLLLVGTNPLPNAVAARLLLAADGCVSLICSKGNAPVGTADVAGRLAKWLKKRGALTKQRRIKEAAPASFSFNRNRLLSFFAPRLRSPGSLITPSHS